jgi:hypothetical protein
MAYSFDLAAPGVPEALAAKRSERGIASDDADTAEVLIREHLAVKSELLGEMRVDRDAGRVIFTIAHTSGKPLRPQDVMDAVFSVPKAVHVLVRERILYK